MIPVLLLRNLLVTLGLCFSLLWSTPSHGADDRQPTVLSAEKIAAAIELDGVADEPSWKQARPLEIRLTDGSIGNITATLRALYDNRWLYLCATWPDPTFSAAKKEWLFDRVTGRWITASHRNRKGETVPRNEDRFSMLWNIDNSVAGFNTAACAIICHGDRMHTNGPDEKIDSWHWKAARTNPLGYADDKWLDNVEKDGYDTEAREAAHHGDARDKSAGRPGLEGNYADNVQELLWQGQTVQAPRYWEPDAEGDDALTITQEEITSGEAILIDDPWSIDRSRPIPAYILFRPVGSRGDIDARGVWHDGIWTLEMRRLLQTGQGDDVQFDIRKLYRFGVAIMDNDGGFDAQGIGHSFDLGARTLEFGGKGSEAATTLTLAADHLIAGRQFLQKNNPGLALSEINIALSLFNDIEAELASLDPALFLKIKSGFVEVKRHRAPTGIDTLTADLGQALLLIQGKTPPTDATSWQQFLAAWGHFQVYFFLGLGLIALGALYNGFATARRREFRLLGIFILLITLPIFFESLGRLGILFDIRALRHFSFMTSEAATLAWGLLILAGLLVSRLGFREIAVAFTALHRQKQALTRQTLTDDLTGLRNRRYLQEKLDEHMAHLERYGTPVSLLMLDIDHFKTINDTYGHACGDLVLQELALLLRKHKRKKIDTAARYGGEEFVILLHNTPEPEALDLAERLRQTIASHPLAWEGTPLSITVSIGVASAPAAGIESDQDLLAKADEALYRAKADGRNCVRT